MTEVLDVRENVPLAPFTTLGIGGPARFYARVESVEAFATAVALARAKSLPLLVLGGGSNLLVADEGFPGLVVRMSIGGVEVRDGEVEAGAGESWDGLVAATVARDLAGFECLSGIPGLVGATPIQNVGAYGQDVRQTVARGVAYDLTSDEPHEFTNEEGRCGYRESRLKLDDRGRYAGRSVAHTPVPGGAPATTMRLRIPAAHYLPVAAGLIPTGRRAPVDGTTFDFRTRRVLAPPPLASDPQLGLAGGYDHCWVLDADADCACELSSATGDLTLVMLGSGPGLQFYNGQFLDRTHPAIGSGVILEPQGFPNAPNEPGFPSSILRPGHTWRATIEYRFRHQ